MRIPTLVAVSLIALAAPLSTAYAADEPPTCLGQSATIVGGEGQVTGTDGADVIVASGSSTVDALGGDDVVCLEVRSVVPAVSEESPVVEVNAGSGDDVVSSEGLDSGWATTVALGTGEDRFLGGDSADTVYGSDPQAPDAERDDIDTRGGSDTVYSGRSSAANDDVVRTGWSGDVVVGAPPSSAGVLDVEGGNNFVAFDLTVAVPTQWRLDVASRTVSRGSETGTWAGRVARWQFYDREDTGPSTFALFGSNHRDWVNMSLNHVTTNIRLGGGDDSLYAFAKPDKTNSYRLGPGNDGLTVAPMNLTRDGLLPGVHVRVEFVAPGRNHASSDAPTAMVSSVESVSAYGTWVRVLGDNHANHITVDGCNIQVRAQAGDDKVYVALADSYYRVRGCRHTSNLDGGPGSDKLYGGDRSTDILVGGLGHDVADGRGGTDTCRAEVTRHCERS